MTPHSAPKPPVQPATARAATQLRWSVRTWAAATIIGQLLFAAFIAAFYYRSIIAGQFANWNEKPLITGFVDGDAIGNGQFAAHVMIAAIMTCAGLCQLLPVVRRRWPAVHRWSGRTFLVSALALSLGGLWLTWGRGSYLAVPGAIAISMDAALIMWFGTMAWRTARQRNFAAHRRWALRTFLVASGVWFMRVGYMVWGITTGGAGISDNLDGPFDLVWAFATHLLPLAVLELYFRAEQGSAASQRAMAAVIGVAALLIVGGSLAAWFIMWAPYIPLAIG